MVRKPIDAPSSSGNRVRKRLGEEYSIYDDTPIDDVGDDVEEVEEVDEDGGDFEDEDG